MMGVGDMGRGNEPPERLTPSQRDLVANNVGLVGVHLRRYVPNLAAPRRDREWEDLFQEGCLGLIQAALRHDPQSGIAFAAFALPRIHNAVSRAIARRFSTVHVPLPRRAGRGERESETSRANDRGIGLNAGRTARPRVFSLPDDAESTLGAPNRHDPTDRHDPTNRTPQQTVGARLREKYERAVASAGRAMAGRSSTRGDRGELVRCLVEGRLLIPHEEARTPLRQIARDTRSSYARVAQCDKQLAAAVRGELRADPEFEELQRRRLLDTYGVDLPLDDELEHALSRVAADEYARRFRAADVTQRARMLEAVLTASGESPAEVVRSRLRRLHHRTREELFRALPPVAGG